MVVCKKSSVILFVVFEKLDLLSDFILITQSMLGMLKYFIEQSVHSFWHCNFFMCTITIVI